MQDYKKTLQEQLQHRAPVITTVLRSGYLCSVNIGQYYKLMKNSYIDDDCTVTLDVKTRKIHTSHNISAEQLFEYCRNNIVDESKDYCTNEKQQKVKVSD